MDRQHDLRVLLVQIQDRLSSEDRHRLHFLVGDLIPRIQRDNVTRTGTLALLESLFDRALVNEDDVEFLIRIFTEMECHDAVRRLQEFQLPKPTIPISEVSNEYTEVDKYRSRSFDDSLGLFSKIDVSSTVLSQPVDKQAIITSELLLPSSDIHELKVNVELKKPIQTHCKAPCLWFLCFLFLCEILGVVIFVWFSVSHRRSIPAIVNPNIKEVYMPELGSFPDGIQGDWFDHSQELSLTYADRLFRLDAYTHRNTLFAINFTYSNNKRKEHQLRDVSELPVFNSSSLDFRRQTPDDISECYTNQTGAKQLIGLDFSLGDDIHKYFGSCPGDLRFNDSFSEHRFAYAQGKTTDYLQGIQFVWFKICSFDNPLVSCVNRNEYSLPSKNYYTD